MYFIIYYSILLQVLILCGPRGENDCLKNKIYAAYIVN